jgi:hypothetical protein
MALVLIEEVMSLRYPVPSYASQLERLLAELAVS